MFGSFVAYASQYAMHRQASRIRVCVGHKKMSLSIENTTHTYLKVVKAQADLAEKGVAERFEVT